MVLTNYTKRTIADLQADDDELLRGVDWAAVQADADINEDVKHALKAAESMMKRDAEQQQGAEHARGTATDKQPAGVPKSAGLTTPLLAAEADVEAGQPVAKKVINMQAFCRWLPYSYAVGFTPVVQPSLEQALGNPCEVEPYAALLMPVTRLDGFSMAGRTLLITTRRCMGHACRTHVIVATRSITRCLGGE